MKKIIAYIRKIIPHNSPIRLWYTRIKNALSGIFVPIKKSDLQHIKIIGVTGTDGKTTTVEIISHILHELNIPHISASSYAIKQNGKVLSMSKRTTSSAYAIRKLLRTAIETDSKVLVLETSSHSFIQWRLWGIRFDVAVLTNITHEHLNFHGTIENYANAKKLLFTKHLKRNGVAILPENDKFGKTWLKELPNTMSYNPDKLKAKTNKQSTEFIFEGKQYFIPMPGAYNAGNALAASLAVSLANVKNSKKQLDFEIHRALKTMKNFTGVPGRMQIVQIPNSEPRKAQSGFAVKDITCIVDFALTEKAMSSALSTAGEIAKNGKVILVFGASGGQHDASVHPGLAKSAALGSDIAIVTDDEPYDGDPDKIRSSLIKYIKNTLQENPDHTCEYHNIADRKEAIRKAIRLAKNGDVVIVTGMGHYTSRTVNGKEVPWSDYEAVKDALLELS